MNKKILEDLKIEVKTFPRSIVEKMYGRIIYDLFLVLEDVRSSQSL
ncbi:hypothetical protein [Desulfurococcus amylolyticus]|nr:hypothetical protein [Desulfurococcus amylolyticus]